MNRVKIEVSLEEWRDAVLAGESGMQSGNDNTIYKRDNETNNLYRYKKDTNKKYTRFDMVPFYTRRKNESDRVRRYWILKGTTSLEYMQYIINKIGD